MVTSDTVLYEVSGPVAHVILNRPAKLNAIDDDALTMLAAHFSDIQSDTRVRAVVIRGHGRAFCVGADLGYVAQCLEEGKFADFLSVWHATMDAIASCSRPTIAAVHGLALAGGLELTHVCDFVVASSDAALGDQHTIYDLFPGGGATQRLPRLVGLRRAKWLLMSGDQLPAEEAARWGLVNRVVAPEDLAATAHNMAMQLASRSPALNSRIKEAVQSGMQMSLDEALAFEREVAAEYMGSTDARRGIEAFQSRAAKLHDA
jgi:enoyl-CoA hydratase/carnithine racemase